MCIRDSNLRGLRPVRPSSPRHCLEYVVMRLSRDDQVAGIPATDARKLMRRFGDAQPESRIGSWVDTGSRTGTEVARAFADAGYLRVSAVYDAEAYWETTIQGNALA